MLDVDLFDDVDFDYSEHLSKTGLAGVNRSIESLDDQTYDLKKNSKSMQISKFNFKSK